MTIEPDFSNSQTDRDDPEAAPATANTGSGGLFKTLAVGVGFLVGLLEPLRHFVINAGVVASLIFGGPAVWKMVTHSGFVIKDISVPSTLSNRGFTGDVIAQQILDHIAEIDRAAGSKADKSEISGFELDGSMPQINLPVGGLNLAAIISELRTLFGYTDTKVTGEIFIADRGDETKGLPVQYGLRLRIAGQGPIFRSDQPSGDVTPLIESAAHEIMHRYDPVNLGYYYYRQHDFKRASALTDEILADPSSPKAPWAYAMRGLIDRDEGLFTDAAVNLREAIALAPKFWLGYVHLAGLLRLDHKLDEAEAAARKAIELSPTQQEGHAALALILLDQGHEDLALAEMKAGVDADPKDPGGHLELGRLQSRLKRFEEALLSFKTSAALRPASEPLLQAADTARKLKRDGDALGYLQQAARSDPKNPDVWLQIGELRVGRNELHRANEAFKKAVALDVRSPDTLVRASKAWSDAKHFSEASSLYTDHLERWGKEPAYLLGWSDLMWAEGKKPEAIAKIREAMEAGSSVPQIFVNAGRLFESHGHTADAIDAYRKAVGLDAKLAEILKPQIDRLAALPPEKPQAPAQPAAAPARVADKSPPAWPAASASPPPPTPQATTGSLPTPQRLPPQPQPASPRLVARPAPVPPPAPLPQ